MPRFRKAGLPGVDSRPDAGMLDAMVFELQLDGLPGPTLSHGGLSPGNVASQAHGGQVSRPRAAARQCLAKMRTVLALGVPQAFLPPLARPDVGFLARLGLTPASAARVTPWLLAAAGSSAFCWTANLGTVAGNRLVVANLAALVHRHLEAPGRLAQLRRFAPGLTVLEPLPGHADLGDEGAANHTLIRGSQGHCHLFVHGRDHTTPPGRQPARQTRAASEAVARLLGITGEALHIRQHPAAIDAGAFHNDVVMVGQGDRLLLHRQAWVDQSEVLAELTHRCGSLRIAEVDALDLDLAVTSYLFNSQLLETPVGWVLVAPAECAEGPARPVVDRLLAEGFIAQVRFVPVRESMRGGGGPACLRLRLPNPAAIAPCLHLDAGRIDRLETWVDRHYRESLALVELADPALAGESTAALADLEDLLAHW